MPGMTRDSMSPSASISDLLVFTVDSEHGMSLTIAVSVLFPSHSPRNRSLRSSHSLPSRLDSRPLPANSRFSQRSC